MMKTEELKLVAEWDKTFPKELLTIPGAVHTDLYDNLKVIPFDKMQQFLKENGVG